MENPFARGLRALRQDKGLTQSELARRSGIARRTLAYWEAGDSLPRIPELQAALSALAATPEETAQLINLLNTPRGLRLAETERTTSEAKDFAGAGTGDLLRAMRMRRRMTQAGLAAQLRINRQSVLRWETGRNLISGENLERLAVVLGAAPEERQALRERRLTMPDWEEDDWRRVTTAEATHLWRELRRPHHLLAPDYRPESPLFELQVLAMKRLLHLRAQPDLETRRLLANLETDYALWLHFQDRVPESRSRVHRAMRLIREDIVPQEFWGEMLNLAASKGYVKTTDWDYFDGVRMMEEWLPRLPPGSVRTQQICDMALYMGMAGHRSKALLLMEQAARSLDRAEDVTASETFYYYITRERIQLFSGRGREISEGLLAQCPSDFQRIHVGLLWTPALLHYGERQAASRYLTQVQAMMTPEIPARLHRLVLDYSMQI